MSGTPEYKLTGMSPYRPNDAALGDGTVTRNEPVWPFSAGAMRRAMTTGVERTVRRMARLAPVGGRPVHLEEPRQRRTQHAKNWNVRVDANLRERMTVWGGNGTCNSASHSRLWARVPARPL